MTAALSPQTESRTRHESEARVLELRAGQVQIADAASYNAAEGLASRLQGKIKDLEEDWAETIEAAHAAHKAALAGRNAITDPLKRALNALREKIANFAVAERRRIAAEQALIEQAAREDRERAALEAAEQAKAEGASAAEVEAVAAEAAMMPLVLPEARPVESVTGKPSVRMLPRARVVDLARFYSHLAAHPAAQHLAAPNEAALNKLAGALGKNIDIPGVEYYETPSTTIRR